jgi:DNA-3-methyladenine glycosylase II
MARLTKSSLRDALNELAGRDADVADALAAYGYPALRRSDRGFKSLLRAIVGQQVSIQAAAAIWERVERGLQDPDGTMAPAALQACDDETLRGFGLSRQKIRYARHLAECLLDGRVRLDRLARMDDEAAIAELVQIKGIGRWTAEIYLLFAHGRPDVFPADDLALMIAAGRMKGLTERPSRADLLGLVEAWRPWRGAAAHLLWHYYRQAPAGTKDAAR